MPNNSLIFKKFYLYLQKNYINKTYLGDYNHPKNHKCQDFSISKQMIYSQIFTEKIEFKATDHRLS